MARRLSLAVVMLLSGCTSLMQTSTDDALEMQRNALLAYQGGEDAKAESLYVGLLKVSPNDAETWFRLGNLYARSNRPDNAADAYQHALLLKPNDARAWYNLGVIRQRQTLAAFIQSLEFSKPGDFIYENSEGLIKQITPNSEKTNPTDDASPSKP